LPCGTLIGVPGSIDQGSDISGLRSKICHQYFGLAKYGLAAAMLDRLSPSLKIYHFHFTITDVGQFLYTEMSYVVGLIAFGS
jgi:hypothetical protein